LEAVFWVLEDRGGVLVAQRRHMRNVPGRGKKGGEKRGKRKKEKKKPDN